MFSANNSAAIANVSIQPQYRSLNTFMTLYDQEILAYAQVLLYHAQVNNYNDAIKPAVKSTFEIQVSVIITCAASYIMIYIYIYIYIY